jgi:hypothetical protein
MAVFGAADVGVVVADITSSLGVTIPLDEGVEGVVSLSSLYDDLRDGGVLGDIPFRGEVGVVAGGVSLLQSLLWTPL